MTETLQHYIGGERVADESGRFGDVFNPAHGAPDADAARLGKALEPRRDIDPVAVDVIAVDDDIAEIDANADYE